MGKQKGKKIARDEDAPSGQGVGIPKVSTSTRRTSAPTRFRTTDTESKMEASTSGAATSTKKRSTTQLVDTPGTSALPLSKVNKIIKADKDVRLCSKEAIFLISKTTEYMIGKLTDLAYTQARMSKREKSVRYSDLATSVWSKPEWFYLVEVIPRTMPFSTALAIRQLDAQNEATQIANSVNSSSKAGPPAKVIKKSRSRAKKATDAAAATGTSVAEASAAGSHAPMEGEDDDDDDGEEEEDRAISVEASKQRSTSAQQPTNATSSSSSPTRGVTTATANGASPFYPPPPGPSVATAMASEGMTGLSALSSAAAAASASIQQQQQQRPSQTTTQALNGSNGTGAVREEDKMQVDR